MRGYHIVAFATGFAWIPLATAGTLTGTVYDQAQTKALDGAQVRIVELNRTTTVDREGRYRFVNVPEGTYTVEASYVGAKVATRTAQIASIDVTTTDFALGTDGSDLYILVIGQYANMSSSLSRQRSADGVSSVLTRDAIGQFPDQNVAESIRRLPGVNVLNDQGEGRFVSVRGLDPELNSASINGVRLPAPEADIRSVALDVIPNELIDSIEIKKTLTPDMDADTIGASIEINTSSAFDRKKDLLNVQLEGSYNDYDGRVTPKGSIDFSKRFNENVGISGGLSYYKRKFETDNIEAGTWTQDSRGNSYAEDVEYRDYDVTRTRYGANLSLDLRASDTTTLYIRGLYNQFDDQEYRRRTVFRFDDFEGEPSDSTDSTATFDDGDAVVDVRRDIKDRFETQKIRSVSLGGKTDTGEWDLNYSASWARSSEYEDFSVDPSRFRSEFDDSGVVVNFDYSDEREPSYTVSSGSDEFNTASNYEFYAVEVTNPSDSSDEEYAVKADVARRLSLENADLTLQTGFKARWRDKSYDLDIDIYDEYNGDYTLADVQGEQSYRLADMGPIASDKGATEFFLANKDDFVLNEEDSLIESSTADYTAAEDVLAGYVLARYEAGMVRAIVGARIERTRTKLTGNLVEIDTGTCGEDVCVTPTSFDNNYTDVLPSFLVRYEPRRDLMFRLGGSASLVRPLLWAMAPRFTIDDGEASFGNPELKPYRAWNLDLAADYYFGANAAVTAGVFYKSIRDFIVWRTDDDGGVYSPGEGVEYAYDEAVYAENGDTATVRGIELSYSQAYTMLPAPFDGLLTNFNYTYTNAKGTLADGRKIMLPTSSKHTANAVLGYEKGRFSLRAAGTYRSKYIDEVGEDASDDRIVDNHFQVDLSSKFRITKSLQLVAEWINVNNAKYFAYQNFGGAKRLLQYEEYGSTFKVGLAATL